MPVQLTISAAISEPSEPDNTRSLIHGVPPFSNSSVVSTPEPAEIDAPENENPSTTPELVPVDTWKSAAAAAPPLAPTRVAPDTIN